MTAATRAPHLHGVAEIRHFFRTNTTPVFFFGATPFNLLGLDRWVRGFEYVTYYDGFDSHHPRVFTPADKPYVEFSSGEEINNHLLRHPEVTAHIASAVAASGARPKVAMVFFDEETEEICRELGYDLILPPAQLREHLDSKLVTTRIANEAGVASVPNTLATVTSWTGLQKVAREAGLGAKLVVQTPYGDSGKTTFFINSKADFDRHKDAIAGEEVKVMRHIRHRAIAVEAVLTRHGTVVGPFMSELTGHAELTPYKGGWCGNEMFPDVLTPQQRKDATELVTRLGDRLTVEGYRGFFEVDILLDLDSGTVYLGELNPRISGATSITNTTAGAYSDMPLFLFHLLEYMGVEYELDTAEVNARWERLAAQDLWSQLIVKQTSGGPELITAAPRTGQYVLRGGELVFERAALDWHQLYREDECFFLRIYGEGDYRWKGADLGVLFVKGQVQQAAQGDAFTLTPRAAELVEAVRRHYAGVPVAVEPATAGVK